MNYQYPGNELELFREAKNWKNYYAGILRPYINGAVLEVGAGIAETSPYLFNEKVSHWTCLEPDEGFFTILQKKINEGKLPANFSAINGTITSLTENDLYDTIVYIDVLEHIEKDRAELQLATKHLKPGGRLIILSPAFQTFYNKFDRAIGHYRRYTKKTLKAVIPGGMKQEKLLYLESGGTLLLLMAKLFKKDSHPSLKQVLFWDKTVVPASKILDKMIGYSYGKTIIGIWEKTAWQQ
jgi:2-polyprenyl-3-methyl-5-hydroxy-6-metoxy-1,4-benzoquinol methylase